LSCWQGNVSITLDEAGISPILDDGSGTVFASGQLPIDASAYNGGGVSIDLINYSSIDNSYFGSAKIVLPGRNGSAGSPIPSTWRANYPIVFGSGGVTPVLIGTDSVIAETAEIMIDGTVFNSTMTAEGGSFFTLFKLQILKASLIRKYAIHSTFDSIHWIS
jgi:hypothetical protein